MERTKWSIRRAISITGSGAASADVGSVRLMRVVPKSPSSYRRNTCSSYPTSLTQRSQAVGKSADSGAAEAPCMRIGYVTLCKLTHKQCVSILTECTDGQKENRIKKEQGALRRNK